MRTKTIRVLMFFLRNAFIAHTLWHNPPMPPIRLHYGVIVLTGLLTSNAGLLYAQDTPSRIAAAMNSGATLEETLRRLTDEVGGRRTGSPAMRRAVSWASEAFRKAGVDSVK